MLFLILCILSSTSIFVIFKMLDRQGIPSFPVIVLNYLTASILGFVINPGGIDFNTIKEAEWLPISTLIGVLFIIMFFLIAFSSQKAGISITTVASKMSVIFPILFSLLIDTTDQLTLIKAIAIFAALAGVALTVFKPKKGIIDPSVIYIPLILFFGMGVVDSLVKFAQHKFVGDSETALFSAILFLNAFLSGVVVLLFFRKYHPSFAKPQVWFWGVLLGAVNFGSIFFLVRALNFISSTGSKIDSSVIFGINNIGVVALSVMLGLMLFREKLRFINWLGILLSALALFLFALG